MLYHLGNDEEKMSIHVQYSLSHCRPNYIEHMSNNILKKCFCAVG